MDRLLWSSVAELLENLAEEDAGAEVSALAASPTDMRDYAAYFDLALGNSPGVDVPPEARAAALAHLRSRIAAHGPIEPEARQPRYTNFSEAFFPAFQLDQMRRWLDNEPANRMALSATSDEDFDRACHEMDVALARLQDASPELYDEVFILIRDVVFSQPDGTQLINYSGASSFPLWGGMTINAETQRDWTQLYRQIVHETGHNLMFGLMREEQMIASDSAQRHWSPVRNDPRPMDGIIHAAFVSAREALAFDALLVRHEQNNCLSKQDADLLHEYLELCVPAFWDCVDILRNTAKLTEFGDRLLRDCEAYMAETFALDPVEMDADDAGALPVTQH